jgi:hypothetical protein
LIGQGLPRVTRQTQQVRQAQPAEQLERQNEVSFDAAEIIRPDDARMVEGCDDLCFSGEHLCRARVLVGSRFIRSLDPTDALEAKWSSLTRQEL